MRTYTINEISKMFEIPASTLRYYEDEELLTKIKRNDSKQRIYEEKHIKRLKTICCLKNAGMPIAALKKFFSYHEDELDDVIKILELLNFQEGSLINKIETLNNDLIHIRKKLAFYQALELAMKDSKTLPVWQDYK